MSKLSKVAVYIFVAAIYVAFPGETCFASDNGDFQWWNTADFSFDINKIEKTKNDATSDKACGYIDQDEESTLHC